MSCWEVHANKVAPLTCLQTRQLSLQALAVEGRHSSKTLQQLQHISPAAADLVTQMLRVKPLQRITAAEAVQHAFIQSW